MTSIVFGWVWNRQSESQSFQRYSWLADVSGKFHTITFDGTLSHQHSLSTHDNSANLSLGIHCIITLYSWQLNPLKAWIFRNSIHWKCVFSWISHVFPSRFVMFGCFFSHRSWLRRASRATISRLQCPWAPQISMFFFLLDGRNHSQMASLWVVYDCLNHITPFFWDEMASLWWS